MSARFTVAIPTHDRRETLMAALRSVLAQTRAPEQVLVLCDGCTDGTAEAARALGDRRVEVIELPKAPGFAYEHRNRSLELARGEVLTWLSDDDLMMPEHLERIGEYWDTDRFDLVQAPAVGVEADDAAAWLGLDWSVPGLREVMLALNTSPMSAVSVRASAARAAGGWDATVPRAGDWDLWKRMIGRGARTGMTGPATILHFRATGRAQAWPARVRQNERWLERMSDPPAELARLRIELEALRSRRDGEWRHALDSLYAAAELAEAERAERTARELSLRAELERERAESRRLREAERTLARVYAGGWWRLRGRVLPLLRLAGRLRDGRLRQAAD